MAQDKQQHQARFWRKFMRLTRGRIDVFHALDVIAQEERDPEFVAILQAIQKELRDGESLSGAFSKHPDTFSLSVRALITSAETSGAWDDVLEEIAAGLEEGTFD